MTTVGGLSAHGLLASERARPERTVFFEIILPPSLSNFAGTAGASDGIVGNFVIGAFATLLATPCSAPFVGSAVGFAHAGGPAQILSIFLALGFGLALPYLAIAAFPSVARIIPRPGVWMVRLRQVLGIALAGTAIWLLTILPAQIGMPTMLAVAALIIAMTLALGAGTILPKLPHAAARSLAAALALAAVGLPLVFGARSTQMTGAASADSIGWVSFDRDKIKSLVSHGKTVFVDVTADWCVVCQSNEKLVINWTSPDAKISAFLSSFGRYGIPLDVVYGPGAPAGFLLPELLTKDAVLTAIDRASRVANSSSLEPGSR